jgi:hypothetical protein
LFRLQDISQIQAEVAGTEGLPDVRVPALFPEACSDGSALLLHNRALISNGLGGSHVANELLYCEQSIGRSRRAVVEAYESSFWRSGALQWA